MRQWWGMRRLGHTLSSKTQLVANDTTFSARGLGLRLQTRGHNGLNYGLNGYASQSTNKDTHTLTQHTHTHCFKPQTQTQICRMIGLNLSKALRNVCTLCGTSYPNNMLLLSSVIQWSHSHRNNVNWLPCWWPPLIIHWGYGLLFLKLLSILFVKSTPNLRL